MNKWLTLIISLSTDNATLRMRAWRGIKASGATTLRDGVYLLPEREACRAVFQGIADEVVAAGGIAYLLEVTESAATPFEPLFDRSEEYRQLLVDIEACARALTAETAAETQKPIRKLRKALAALVEIDFFPGEAQRQAEAAQAALETAAIRLLSPDEPHFAIGQVPPRELASFQGRQWATRQRPWVDRLASAWLIRRLIDREAHFLWLATPAGCPGDAIGFDFDGATFTHVGAKVTFETLLASFDLETPALARLGGIVHFLDVGGVQPAEAAGVEQILSGLREALTDDDQLLTAASGVFDGLLAAFQKNAHDSGEQST